jgi:hypothetical protein
LVAWRPRPRRVISRAGGGLLPSSTAASPYSLTNRTKLNLRRPTTTTPPMAAPVSQPPVAARASSRFFAHGLGAVPESAPASLRFSVGRNRRAARLGPSGCSPLILVLGTEIISRGGWACGPVVKAHGRARAGGGSSPRPAPQGRGKNAVSLKKIISRASLSF